jgi:dihydroflavonol-4-reductase
MSEKVAVIGGTGFLGSNLVTELLKAGYIPIVVARKPDRIAKVLPGIDVEARQGDLTDLDSLHSALKGCDMVHSVAALMSQVYVNPSPDLLEAAIRTNVEGTLNALRAAREVGVRRVIVTSTAGIRYQPGGALTTEDSPPPDPKILDDAYIRSKLLEEAAVAAFVRETNLEVVSVLPGAMVGPRDGGPTPLGRVLVEYLNGRASVSVDGIFPVVDVRDVARAHVAAMEQGMSGKSYLVVTKTISFREWYDILTRLTGLSGPRVFIPSSIAMSMAYLAEFLAQVAHRAPQFTRNQVQHLVLAVCRRA